MVLVHDADFEVLDLSAESVAQNHQLHQGMTMETIMRVGLRRKRRKSRSMMARMRFISLWPRCTMNGRLDGGRSAGVAQLMPGVMDENIVQRGALHGERGQRDAGLPGRFHQGDGGARAVVGGDAETCVLVLDFGHFGKFRRVCCPARRHAEKPTSRMFLPGNGGLQFEGESSAASFPWSTMAMRSQSLSASSM